VARVWDPNQKPASNSEKAVTNNHPSKPLFIIYGAGVHDVHLTPVGMRSGASIHATALANALEENKLILPSTDRDSFLGYYAVAAILGVLVVLYVIGVYELELFLREKEPTWMAVPVGVILTTLLAPLSLPWDLRVALWRFLFTPLMVTFLLGATGLVVGGLSVLGQHQVSTRKWILVPVGIVLLTAIGGVLGRDFVGLGPAIVFLFGGQVAAGVGWLFAELESVRDRG
jgi:hypothetical protein